MKLYINKKLPKYKEKVFSWLIRLYKNSSSFPQTFKDINFQKEQCRKGRSRSFDDLYSLVTTYYPDTTKVELAKYVKLLILHIYNNLCLMYCPDAKAWVIYTNPLSRNNNNNYKLNKLVYNYNGYLYKKYKDGCSKETSLYDILLLMGYDEELLNEEFKAPLGYITLEHIELY